MKKLQSDNKKVSELFGESNQNLHQIPSRFKSSTLQEIEEISEAHGVSKAETIRKLVGKGLEEIKK